MVDDPAELAQQGLGKIERAILQVLGAHPQGLRNADVAEKLGLRSDFNGRQKDYLTYSVLGRLLRTGRVERDEKTKLFRVR
jgi:hypothetical protein